MGALRSHTRTIAFRAWGVVCRDSVRDTERRDLQAKSSLRTPHAGRARTSLLDLSYEVARPSAIWCSRACVKPRKPASKPAQPTGAAHRTGILKPLRGVHARLALRSASCRNATF